MLRSDRASIIADQAEVLSRIARLSVCRHTENASAPVLVDSGMIVTFALAVQNAEAAPARTVIHTLAHRVVSRRACRHEDALRPG